MTMKVDLNWLWFWPLILGDYGNQFIGWIPAITSILNPWLHFASRSQRLCALIYTSEPTFIVQHLSHKNWVSRFRSEFDSQASDAVRIEPMWSDWIAFYVHGRSDPFLRVLEQVNILLLILMPFNIVLIGSICKNIVLTFCYCTILALFPLFKSCSLQSTTVDSHCITFEL